MDSLNKYEKEKNLILDGSKLLWHQDRLQKWINNERFAPITIDMALTRACNYHCEYCYGMLQENEGKLLTWDILKKFLEDCAEIGVKGISLVSDGESTLNKTYIDFIVYGNSLGIDMAMGTNGYLTDRKVLEQILPAMTYFRFNITAGESKRYAEIHGVPEEWFYKVVQNIKDAVAIKKQNRLSVTIGLQMVLMPEYEDQIIPLAQLGKELKPDYLVIKHCSDDEDGALGVDYNGYEQMYEKLKLAEQLSDDEYLIKVKWSKIEARGKRTYEKCYGPPFIMQLSGSGLVAPCGMLFNEKYKKYHIGNIAEKSFKDIVFSDRYWEIINEISSDKFNAKTMCGSLCLQHKTNEILDAYRKGEIELKRPEGESPIHINFI